MKKTIFDYLPDSKVENALREMNEQYEKTIRPLKKAIKIIKERL